MVISSGTYPIRAFNLSGLFDCFISNKETSPESGAMIEATIFMVVVLPEPFGPIKPVIDPGSASKKYCQPLKSGQKIFYV